MIEPGQEAASRPAWLASAGLFVVERRLPKITDQELAVMQAALTDASRRFSDRGDGVRYLGSVLLARRALLLSFFTADSSDAVRAVNEAALIPFVSIEPAIELPGLTQP